MRAVTTAFFVIFFTTLNGIAKGLALLANLGINLISDKHGYPSSKPAQKEQSAPLATTLATKTVLVSPGLSKEKLSPDPLVLRTAMESIDPAKLRADTSVMVADRTLVLPLESQNRHPFGKAWIYLYKDAKIARRLLVIQDTHLARIVCGPGEHRYFFKDVEYLAERGTNDIVAEFMKEIQALLRKKRVVDQNVQPVPQASPVKVAKPSQPCPAEITTPVAPAAQTPNKPAAPKEQKAATKPVNRSVTGQGFVGIVVDAARTTKQGPEGPYNTFCLTLNDGSRELPFNGAEVERLCRDLKIQVGERVKVVDMGKMDVTVPGVKHPRQKNLFQITRIGAN